MPRELGRLELPTSRQQLIDPMGRMRGDASQDVSSQACGSTSFGLAVTIRLSIAARCLSRVKSVG
jgi:hypothetical protein